MVGQITGTCSLPKGHLEAGETELEAAVREIAEEVGVVVGKPITRYPAYTRQSGRRPDEAKQIVMFLFAVDGEPELTPLDATNSDARWLSPDDALVALSYPEDREFLRSALAEITDGS